MLALDTKTGKIVWEQTAYEGPVFDARHRRSTFAGPTAITDGKMVLRLLRPGGALRVRLLRQARLEGGREVPHPRSRHRHVADPLSEPRSSSSATRTKRRPSSSPTTRRPARKCGRRSARCRSAGQRRSWSTAGSRTELVTNGSEHVIAYDPATGKELWKTKGVESNAIHTPLVGKGLVIVTAGFPAKKIIAIRTGEQPDDKRVAWEYTKGTGYVLSNILYGDYVYLSTDNGIITCLDAATGEVMYEGGRPPKPTHFMGSAVAYNGMIAMTSEDGDTFMLKAGPKHEIVRTNISRRTGVFLARAGQRPRLHPRRQTSVRDRQVITADAGTLPSAKQIHVHRRSGFGVCRFRVVLRPHLRRTACAARGAPSGAARPHEGITETSVRSHMEFLASDAMNGRAQRLARRVDRGRPTSRLSLRRWGLEPLGDDGGYVQTIAIERPELGAPPVLSAGGRRYIHGKEITVASMTRSARLRSVDAPPAGHGRSARRGASYFPS